MRREYRPGGYIEIDDVSHSRILRHQPTLVDLSNEMQLFEAGVLSQHYIETSSVKNTKYLVGESLPDWRDRISAGTDATTPLTAGMQWVEPGLVTATVSFSVAGTPYYTTYRGASTYGTFDTSLTLNDDPDQLARIKLWRKIRNHYEKMAGGPFLGELGKTLRDIRRPAKALSDLTDDWLRSNALRNLAAAQKAAGYEPDSWNGKKRRRPSGSKIARGLAHRSADAWLTYAFSARPLVADITGAAEALASLVETPLQRTIVAKGEAEGSHSFVVERSMNGSGAILPLIWQSSIEDRTVKQVIYRAHIIARAAYDGPLDQIIDMGRKFGLSPGNLIATGYELIPWTFLWDYFNTLGDVVNAQAVSIPGLNWMNRSTRTLYERKVGGYLDVDKTRTAYAARNWPVYGVVGDVYRCRNFGKSVVRESVLPSWSMPRLEFRTRLSPMKLTNIAALLAGLFGR